MYILKGLLVICLLGVFFFLGLILYPFYILNKDLTRPTLSKLIQCISKLILIVLNVKIDCDFKENSFKGKTIVCNHLSYLDMLVILSKLETSFLTSYEIKETPFLGQICELAGCFFTERRNKKNLLTEVAQIKTYLKRGHNITFFPEGTSTDASEIKTFKKPFFYPSFELKEKIIVLTLNYTHIDDESFSRSNADKICWYGDMTFFDHFISLLKIKSIKASLTHKAIVPSEDISQTVDECRCFIIDNFQVV